MTLKHLTIGILIGLIVLQFLKSDVPPATVPGTPITPTATSYANADDEPLSRVGRADPHSNGSIADDTDVSGPIELVSSVPIEPTRHAPANSIVPLTKEDSPVKRLLRESIEEAIVKSPTANEIDEFERLFLRTLEGNTSIAQLQEDWNRGGWELQTWNLEGVVFAAVSEQPGRRHGRGIYLLRPQSRSVLAVQAPHRFFDGKTGLLTRQLFEERDILAAAWNTVHRRQIDIAHQSEHFINAMTRALLRYRAEIVVAQVHGFANEHQQREARDAAVIVSDTTQYPGRIARGVTTELKSLFDPSAVRLYPIEVHELGGTLNRQAKVFHDAGRTGFLHLELNRATREAITSEAALRDRFFTCITQTNRKQKILVNP